ncbi:hypothetical protein DFJ73DRAFT_761397 [Zopfochytrium polystomum]|nr:hypothetical protein DFJ73DRAFT_761397 [Zopfochytrium polystomum]
MTTTLVLRHATLIDNVTVAPNKLLTPIDDRTCPLRLLTSQQSVDSMLPLPASRDSYRVEISLLHADANGRRLGRNRVSKLQYQYNRNAQRAEDMSLLLVSSAAAGQAETVVRTLMDRVLPARPLPSRRSKADPAPNGAGARRPKGKEPDTRQNKQVTRVDVDTVPGTQGSAAGHQGRGPQQTQVAVHQVVVPEDPIPASLVSHFATNPTPASARVIVDQLPENARAVLRFLLGNNAVTPSPPPYSSAPPPAVEHTDNIGDASADNDEACDTYSVYEPSSPLVLPTSPTASEAVSPGNTAPVPTDPTVTVETSNSDNDTNIA